MNNLFNKSFFKFAVGFIGILLISFVFSAVIAKLDTRHATPASVSGGR